jgi:hypothetical protein
VACCLEHAILDVRLCMSVKHRILTRSVQAWNLMPRGSSNGVGDTVGYCGERRICILRSAQMRNEQQKYNNPCSTVIQHIDHHDVRVCFLAVPIVVLLTCHARLSFNTSLMRFCLPLSRTATMSRIRADVSRGAKD